MAELEARVRDLDLRVRAIEQEQGGNLRLSQAILTKVDLLAEDSRAGFIAVRNEIAAVRAEMAAGFADVRSELASTRAGTEAGFTAVQSELIATQANIAVLRSDIAEIKDILKGGSSGTGR